MKVIVCGGRDYGFSRDEKSKIFKVLDQIHAKYTITELIHGSCKGVDEACEEWAKSREVDYKGYPAKWKRYGNAAGPLRNTAMLQANVDAKCLVSFPGGKGTRDMMNRCTALGLKVLDMSKSSLFR